MRIDALKYRTEESQDVIIVVEFYSSYTNKSEWRISEIKYKTSRQRQYRYYTDTFKDCFEYRKLDSNERDLYAMKKFEEFVGREKLQDALIAAWESFKPDLNNFGVSKI